MPDLPTRHRPPDPTADLPVGGHTPDLSGGLADTPGPVVPPPAGGMPVVPVVPGYELVEEVGRGGMGVVYRARDVAFGRDVAVKLLQDRFPADGVAARRFADEAQITGQLQHPGVPAAYQTGTLPDGRPFLAMKLIKGQTLDDLVKDPGTDRGRLVAAFEGVCQAVGYAHAHGVIHRDLKPANVMVGSFGEVQVMDWGLAKVLTDRRPEVAADDETTAPGTAFVSTRDPADVTKAGSLLGTPAYMAPEQAIGAVDEVDRRSDVFGLGAVLCAVLTGHPPYRGGSAEANRKLAARAELADATARLDGCGADPGLVALCRRCLSAKREDRPADGGAVAAEVAALRAAADDRARQAELDRVRVAGDLRTAEVRAAEGRKRQRVQRLLFAAGLLVVAVVGVGAWYAQKLAADRERVEDAARLDKAVRDERARAGVDAALAGLPELYRRALWKRAEGVVDEADALLGPDGDPALRERVAAARRDTAFVARLDRVRLEGLMVFASPARGRDTIGPRYEAAFRDYGLDLTATDPAETARLIRASGVREFLLAALDEWAFSHVFDGPAAYRRAANTVAAVTGRGLWAEMTEGVNPVDGRRLAAAYDALPAERRSPVLTAMVGGVLSEADGGRRLEEGLRRHPADFFLHFAYLAVTSEGPVDRAVGAHWAALALRPGNPVVLNSLGLQLARRGDPDGAAACYREAAANDPEYSEPHGNLGNLLNDRGDLDGALAAYREALRRQPDRGITYNNMADALRRKGDRAGAEAAYRDAVRVDPGYAPVYYRLAHLLDAKGDVGGAEAAYRTAADLFEVDWGPGKPPGRFPWAADRVTYGGACCNLGSLIAGRRGRPADALPWCDKAVAALAPLAAKTPPPESAREYLHNSRLTRAEVLAHVGRPEEAVAEYRQAAADARAWDDGRPESRTRRATVEFRRGQLFDRLKQPADAEAAFREAAGLYEPLAAGGSAEAGVMLGGACSNVGRRLLDRGQPADALPWFRKAEAALAPLAAREPPPRYAREFLKITRKSLSDAQAAVDRRPAAETAPPPREVGR